MANFILLVGLLLGLLGLRHVTDDGIFATIVIVVFGVIWAHALYTSRGRRPRDRRDRTVDRSR